MDDSLYTSEFASTACDTSHDRAGHSLILQGFVLERELWGKSQRYGSHEARPVQRLPKMGPGVR